MPTVTSRFRASSAAPPDALAARVGAAVRDPAGAALAAATEAARAAHLGRWLAGRAWMAATGGRLRKRGVASAAACPACRAIDGRTVEYGEPFAVDRRGGPYAATPYPPLHPRCRCTFADIIT